MQSEVMFAGFGGQGILLSAKILAHAAMEEGREVVWIPSYGPEMRGEPLIVQWLSVTGPLGLRSLETPCIWWP